MDQIVHAAAGAGEDGLQALIRQLIGRFDRQWETEEPLRELFKKKGELLPAAAVPDFLESAELDKLLPALSKACAAMVNPYRDKEATVRGKTPDGRDYQYTYRYATLASVNNSIREPLTSNGFTMPMARPIRSTVRAGQYDLFVQLRHESCQWIGCIWPLVNADSRKAAMQDFAGQTTYGRRTATMCILGVAAGDEEADDDANRASGHNAAINVVGAMQQGFVDEENGKRSLQKNLLTAAANASGAQQVTDLLETWSFNLHLYGAYQNDPDQRPIFDQAMAAIRSALDKIEPALGDLFVAIATAGSKWDAQQVHHRFLGTSANGTATALKAVTKKYQQLWGFFRQHLEFFWERAVLRDPDGRPDINDAVAQNEGRWVRTAAEAQDKAKDALNVQSAPAFAFYIRDEIGEIASDELTDPVSWAEFYAELWHASEDRPGLQKANNAALEALQEHDGAVYRLDELLNATPELETVADDTLPPKISRLPAGPMTVPAGRGGGIDLKALLSQVRYELSQYFQDCEDVAVWNEMNRHIWEAEGFNEAFRMKIQAAIMARKKEVGG